MNPFLRFGLWLDIKVLWVVTLGKWQGKVLVPIIDLMFRPWMTDHCRKAYLWQKDIYQ